MKKDKRITLGNETLRLPGLLPGGSRLRREVPQQLVVRHAGLPRCDDVHHAHTAARALEGGDVVAGWR
jgi:hypothetical protein